jgi:hypothetical protein
MPKQFFEPTRMTSESLAMVKTINAILESYKRQGYDLSLRQTYYQLVARALIPNTEQSYKRIGGILSDARMCGYIDWDMIVDRGRETTQNNHWDSPSDIVTACAKQFRYELWMHQPWWVEVMVEKQALEGVLEPVCKSLDIPFTANKGYSSSSAMHEAGVRLRKKLDEGKNICVIYLGDHDPSGIDMTRDVEDRLKLFSGYEFYAPKATPHTPEFEADFRSMNIRRFERYLNGAFDGQEFLVERVALTMDQIEKYNPPPNPAKLTDSRSDKYVQEFGDESWELDALEPAVLAQLVEDKVEEYRDEDLFQEASDRQDAARERLMMLAKTVDDE